MGTLENFEDKGLKGLEISTRAFYFATLNRYYEVFFGTVLKPHTTDLTHRSDTNSLYQFIFNSKDGNQFRPEAALHGHVLLTNISIYQD